MNQASEKIKFVYDRKMGSEKPVELDKNLQRLLDRHHLSQNKVARELKINKSTLHNYINGILPQGLLPLLKICAFFEVSLDELVFGSVTPEEIDSMQPFLREEKYEVVIKRIQRKRKE